ncbi:hypothetical protein HL658_33375 [Azospirillum sp. RWY-5-1]|uniref:Integrase catalytic domain-containing protein n=1 Tax=Azospirillum oleiclasticum TaxID=2735135 RepID=A0ABX2TKF5_9PROT|nr:integrase core domain-containing protein [Azospirillum oleiclasticum]NYZ17461.1 hypothetical protein [Azospirillum oleiclasticum]NYZ24840.1 hypothetical protein [Azospirillum oleiclasticum]
MVRSIVAVRRWAALAAWKEDDNADRPHSALGGRTPDEAHEGIPDGIDLAA